MLISDPQARSNAPLAREVKANLLGYYRYLGRSQAAKLYQRHEHLALISGFPDPFLNVALSGKLHDSQVNEVIDGTIKHFQEGKVPEFYWWLEDEAEPPDLGLQLMASGVQSVEGPPGMALYLAAMVKSQHSINGLQIETVMNERDLMRWASVATEGFGFAEDIVEPFFNLINGLGFDLPLINYLATVNNEPAAVAQLFLGEKSAGIYVVATLEKFRGQGIGSAITACALEGASAFGYQLAVLQTSEMGESVYGKLGFQHTGRLPHYLWKK